MLKVLEKEIARILPFLKKGDKKIIVQSVTSAQ
jgi:hypothetical protein